MNMICPHCGLQGKAEESLLGKKVRCPECQKVFRAEEQKLETEQIDQPLEQTAPPAEPAVVEQTMETPAEPAAAPAAQAPPVNDTTCYKCGYAFDEFFGEEGGQVTICSVCGRKRPVSA